VYLKTLLGVRDDSATTSAFSAILASRKRRFAFVMNLFNFIKHHKFDGVEINWARPANYGDIEVEKVNHDMITLTIVIFFLIIHLHSRF
jgi:GH18 family chitinase